MEPTSTIPEICTPRLWLRGWGDSDREPFRLLNADARVMEYLLGPVTPAQSDAFLQRIAAHFAQHGFGLWAVGIPAVAEFIGFVGLNIPSFRAHFTPCVEVGWRLSADHWGHGYASEAAGAALDFAFNRLSLDEVVSFTVPANGRSRRVMERIGMRHEPADDFDHPGLPEGHPLRRHVLYRISRREWARR